MRRYASVETPPPSPPPPRVVMGGTPPRAQPGWHDLDVGGTSDTGSPPPLLSSLAILSSMSPSPISADAAARLSMNSAPCPVALPPSLKSRPRLGASVEANRCSGRIRDAVQCRGESSPPPVVAIEGAWLDGGRSVDGCSPIAPADNSARRCIRTNASFETAASATPAAVTAGAARSREHAPAVVTEDSASCPHSNPAASTCATSTSTRSNPVDGHTGSSDARTRCRPPRLALRLFDQPDDCDSSLDHSRTADRTALTASFSSFPASRAPGAETNAARELYAHPAVHVPLFAPPAQEVQTSLFDRRSSSSASTPVGMCNCGRGDDAATFSTCREHGDGSGRAARHTDLSGDMPSGRRHAAHAHRPDDDDQADRELVELLFVQTPLSPCASFTAPHFSVMTSRSSTSHFSPVNTNVIGGATASERANSTSFGVASRHVLAPVSSRAIVERHLRRQQQQQQQQSQYAASQSGSHVGSFCYRTHGASGTTATESVNGSFTCSHYSVYSGSPAWSVSRGVSPQSPATGVSPGMPTTTSSPALTAGASSRTRYAFPSVPSNDPHAAVTTITAMSAATTPTNRTPHPEMGSYVGTLCSSRSTGSTPKPCACDDSADSGGEAERSESGEASVFEGAPVYLCRRRPTLQPQISASQTDIDAESDESTTKIANRSDASELNSEKDSREGSSSSNSRASLRVAQRSRFSPRSLACAVPCDRDAMTDWSPPGPFPRRCCSPTRDGRGTTPGLRGAAARQGHSPRPVRVSDTHTQGSSPHFSASASYAALTLGDLMTPEGAERERSSQETGAMSFPSFLFRSATATPTHVQRGTASTHKPPEDFRAHHRGHCARGPLAALQEAPDLPPRAGTSGSARRSARLKSPRQAPLVASPRSASPGILRLAVISGSGSHTGLMSPLTPVTSSRGRCTPRSPTRNATPPRFRREEDTCTPTLSLPPSSGRQSALATASGAPLLTHTTSLDDLTIRSHNAALSDALHAVWRDADTTASADTIQLPAVLHTTPSTGAVPVTAEAVLGPPSNAVTPEARLPCATQPVAHPSLDSETPRALPPRPLRRRPAARRERDGTTAPVPLFPFFGQLSVKGCRSYQEDSVLLLPEVRVRLDEDAAVHTPCPDPGAEGVPHLETATGVCTSRSAEAEVGETRTFSCFGVFDGHNGDEVSTRAQQYFLDHFEVSYQHYHTQACHQQKTCVDASGEISVSDEQRSLSAALVQTLLHLDVTIYDQLQTPKAEAGSTACVMACALPPVAALSPASAVKAVMDSHGTDAVSGADVDESADNESEGSDGVDGVDYLDVAIANLGDSRAVVGNISTGSVILQTIDHRVRTYPSEEARIRRCGGTVEFDRVEGCYDVTRGLGDYHLKCSPDTWWCPAASADPSPSWPLDEAAGISSPNEATPRSDVHGPAPQGSNLACNGHVSGHMRGNVIGNIADVYEVRVGAGDFVILASDGVWDRVSSEEAVTFVADALQPFFESLSRASTAVMTPDRGGSEGNRPRSSHTEGAEEAPCADVTVATTGRAWADGEKASSARLDAATCRASSAAPCATPIRGAADNGSAAGVGRTIRATTTSSGGLTSEGPQRSPTACSLPTICQIPEGLPDTRATCVYSQDALARPRATGEEPVKANDDAVRARPCDEHPCEYDGETASQLTPKHPTSNAVGDSDRSPSFRLPSASQPRRTAGKPDTEPLEPPAQALMSATRRCRRLSTVDLVQRDALSSEVLERRVQQQPQSTHHTAGSASSLVHTPSSFGTPSSVHPQPPRTAEEVSEGLSSTSALSSLPRTALGASSMRTPSSCGRRTPPPRSTHGVAASRSSALAPEFQTPTRSSTACGAAGRVSSQNLALMVRRVSAALVDYALLERNSGDNVTVVLVVFAPMTSASSCPVLSTSLAGYQSP